MASIRNCRPFKLHQKRRKVTRMNMASFKTGCVIISVVCGHNAIVYSTLTEDCASSAIHSTSLSTFEQRYKQ